MITKLAIATIVACIFSKAAYGGELYRWTDEQGRTHYGDSVPAVQKNRARVVDLTNADTTEAQRREAEARLSKGRDRLKQPTKANAPSAIAAPANTQAGNQKGSCEEQWKKYDESWACFNPYRTANGSVKAEAYEHCTEMKAPDCKLEVK